MEIIRIGKGEEAKAVFWPGHAAGSFLVYLNGLESNHSWFSPVAERLALSGMNVVALDRRGSGINQGLAGKAKLWLRDVAELAAWIRGRNAQAGIHLGSLCFGALPATAFALRHIHLISSLIYISPGLRTRVHPPFCEVARAALSRLLGGRRLVSSPVKDVTWFTGQQEAQEWIRRDPLRKKEFLPSEFIQALILRWQILRAKKGYTRPVLVLLAENDRIIDKSRNILVLKRLFRGEVRVREYPGAFHCLFFEPGLDLAGDIRAWMAETG